MVLRHKDLQTLHDIFASIEIPFEVWAYGSRVNGSAHEGSDLDLVIRSKHLGLIDADIFFEIKDKIQQSNIPILVDLLDWAGLPVSFQENIKAQYEVLFQSPAFENKAMELTDSR